MTLIKDSMLLLLILVCFALFQTPSAAYTDIVSKSDGGVSQDSPIVASIDTIANAWDNEDGHQNDLIAKRASTPSSTPVSKSTPASSAATSAAPGGSCASKGKVPTNGAMPPSPSKRWYAIDGTPYDSANPKAGKTYTWPVMCKAGTPVQPIRYCFADKRSADNLTPILNNAIARWAPAMVNSALSIDLDSGTGGNPHIYCDDQNVHPDALVITDKTKEGDDEYNWEVCDTESTTGYDYSSDTRGRHTLDMCHLKPDAVSQSTPWAVRAMMHELGHVMGLQHEHQRPDRGTFLFFKPKNLNGYQAAREKAKTDAYCLFEAGDSMDHRLKMITHDETHAAQYWPEVLPWIQGDWMDGDDWKYYVFSKNYDRVSIMNYDSTSNTISKDNFVAWMRTGEPIWMGGSPDPNQASISAGDIARIAQLYPSGTDAGKAAMDEDNWGTAPAKQVRVKIRDFETMVYMPNRTAAGS